MGASDPLLLIASYLLLGMIPLMMVMTTSFTKISIVLVLLRNSLGVQQAPSNLAIAGLALAITMLVMKPVWTQIADRIDIEAVAAGEFRPSIAELLDAIEVPLKGFMGTHVSKSGLERLSAVVEKREVRTDSLPDAVHASFSLLAPAFILSEIGSAFKIGMLLAIGFAVIDILIANLLMAMGMTMFPPSTVAVPLKLLVFVMTAGLSQLTYGLIQSYQS